MSASERRKGVEAEREVVRILREAGVPCHRVPNSGGLVEPGDVAGIIGYHLEVKRQETVRLPLWLEQAEREAPAGACPVVAYRRSSEPWRAVLPLSELARLLAIEKASTA